MTSAASFFDRDQLLGLLDELAEGMVVFEAGGIAYANAAALAVHQVASVEQLGATLDAYRATFVLRYLNGHVLSGQEHPVDRLLAGDAFAELVVEIARADSPAQNAHRTVVLRTVTVPGRTGEPALRILAFRDDTEAMNGEKRFEQAFAANPMPAMVCRLHDHRFVRVNDGFLAMTGYRREAVIGHSVYEIDVLEGVENRERAVNLLAEGHTIPQTEARLKLPDGGSKLVVVAGQPVELGQHRCMLFTFTDLEHRSKAEAVIRQSEERFATAFRMTPIPMLITTLAEHRILDANDAFVREFGHERSGAIGRSKADLAMWADMDARRTVESQLARTGHVRTIEIELRTSGGQVVMCQMSSEGVTILDERCVLTVIQNVAAQRRSDTQLAAAVEAVMQDASWLGQKIIAKINAMGDRDAGNGDLLAAADLSQRERQVLALIARGATDKAIAVSLKLSFHTVKNHVRSIYRKIGVNKRAEAVAWARHCGIVNHAFERR